MSETPRCSALVWDRFLKWQGCSRAGAVERNGRLWCRQHDPEAVRARSVAAWKKDVRERAIQAAAQDVANAKTGLIDVARAVARGERGVTDIGAAVTLLDAAEAELARLRAEAPPHPKPARTPR